MAFGAGEYLLRLRERALVRVRRDEDVLGLQGPPDHDDDAVMVGAPRSRRGALRLMGMAAAGVVVGALRARAEGVMSLRSAAPQYGAPAVIARPALEYESEEPRSVMGDPAVIVRTRKELGEGRLWSSVEVPVVPDTTGTVYDYVRRVPYRAARVVYYAAKQGSGVKAHALAMIADPETKTTFLMPGGQNFYFMDDGEMWAFLAGEKELFLHKSLLHIPSTDAAGSLDEAIRAMAERVSEAQLRIPESSEGRVSGWKDGPTFGSGIYAISVTKEKVFVGATERPYSVTVNRKTRAIVK